MNGKLEGVENQGKRADILVKGLNKINKFVENVEKQASKGKFSKIMNVIKTSLKVVCTLGRNKSTKLELASAKFAMNNKNAEQLKATAVTAGGGSKELKVLTKRANENRSQGR